MAMMGLKWWNARSRVLIVGLVLLGAALGGTAGWLLEQRAQPRGVLYGVPRDYALADHSLGANVDLTQLDGAARAQLYRDAACLGLRWLRVPIARRAVERGAGQYDWSSLDAPIREARAHGLQILVLLVDAPNAPPPDDMRMIGAFARAAAAHFADDVAAYQIWDEPNIAAGWGGKFPDAVAYTTQLREAAINIRAANPRAHIISAALAPTTESGPLNLNEPEFLRQMYRAGARDFFDALGAEPFGFWSGPDDRRVDVGALNFSRLILLRDVMQANGDGDKAIWATAFGWSVNGAGSSAFGSDAQALQFARTQQAIERARDEWPWLGPLLFTRWRPYGTDDPRAGFALFTREGGAWLWQGAEAQCGKRVVASVGRYNADHAAARYPDGWRVSPEGADVPQGASAPMQIRFRGTRVDLRVRRGPFEAFLFARVDGVPANALPRDEQGRAYVVLYDPLAQSAEVTLARGLSDGEHVVELTPQGGWGQWAISGWIVSRELATDGRWPLMGALVGVLLAGVLALVLMQPQVMGLSQRVRAVMGSNADTRVLTPVVFLLGIALYLSPNLIVSWTSIALLALLIVWRLEAGLALVAFAIPFYLQPKPLGIGSYAVVEIVVLLCALSFMLRGVELRPARLLRHMSAFDALVVLWLAAGVMGVAAAENFGVANRELRVVFIEPALYYLMVRASHIRVRPLVDALLLGAALISAKAVLDWITHTDLITAEGVLRARSVYFSPNNLALYLDRAVPIALALTLFGRTRRIIYAIALALLLAALYLTFAKGAWLVALPASLLFVGMMRGRRVLLGALVALALLGVSLLPVLGTERVRSLFDLTTGTGFIRVQVWQAALAMIRDHPLFGVGLDNFLYEYRTRYILPSAFAEPNLSHPHNIALDFWTRLGLPGLALLGALLVIFWRRALTLYRALPEGDTRALVLGLMASMVAALAHGLIDNSFFLVDLAFVLMLTLAAMQVESQRAARAGAGANY